MIVAGIGSRKGVSMAQVIGAVEAALEAHGLAKGALSALATTAFKRDEEAIFAAGRELGLPVIVVEGSVSPPVMPPHPASAPLGHPLPVGERSAFAVGANLPATTRDAAAVETTTPRNEQITGIGDRSLLPNGEKVAAKRPDEGAVQTLTHSQLSQALAGVPSVSEAAALASAAGANLPATTRDAAAVETTTSRNEQNAGIGGRSLLPNGEKVAAKRPDEGAVLHTLTHSELSQALAGVPSVSEAAALGAAGEGARLLGPRIVAGPVTCALATSGGAA